MNIYFLNFTNNNKMNDDESTNVQEFDTKKNLGKAIIDDSYIINKIHYLLYIINDPKNCLLILDEFYRYAIKRGYKNDSKIISYTTQMKTHYNEQKNIKNIINGVHIDDILDEINDQDITTNIKETEIINWNEIPEKQHQKPQFTKNGFILMMLQFISNIKTEKNKGILAIELFTYMFIDERRHFYYMFLYYNNFYTTVNIKMEELRDLYNTMDSLEHLKNSYINLCNEFENIRKDILLS